MSARSFIIKPNLKQGNIKVETLQGLNGILQYDILLHGHKVFSIEPFSFTISDCGYKTNTTKTAINRALELFELPYKMYQLKGQWYINGSEFNGQLTIKR